MRALRPQPRPGAGRLGRHRARLVRGAGLGFAAGVVAVAVWASGRMPFDQLIHRGEYQTSAFQRAEGAAVAVVPNGATVEASDTLAPHLVDRDRVMLLDATPRDAPWIVFDQAFVEFPLSDAVQIQVRAVWLRAHGYREVFSRDGVDVYHRSNR